MKNLFIHFADKGKFTYVFPCTHKVVDENTLDLFNFVNQSQDVVILEFKHNQFGIRLRLAELDSHEIWYFDENNSFSRKANSLQNSNATIHINTVVPYLVLFARANNEIIKSSLLINCKCISMELSDTNPFDGLNSSKHTYPLPCLQNETGTVIRAAITLHLN